MIRLPPAITCFIAFVRHVMLRGQREPLLGRYAGRLAEGAAPVDGLGDGTGRRPVRLEQPAPLLLAQLVVLCEGGRVVLGLAAHVVHEGEERVLRADPLRALRDDVLLRAICGAVPAKSAPQAPAFLRKWGLGGGWGGVCIR